MAVRLIDGSDAPSDSEAWRHECEARHIAALPTLAQRREHLGEIERRRGQEAAGELRATIKRLWKARER